jgi:hypothetical protein
MPRRGRVSQAVAALSLLLASGGCAGQTSGTTGDAGNRSPAAMAGVTVSRGTMQALAAQYLAIAVPANHQLEREDHAFDHNAHVNLAAAEQALRAEAATERRFDNLLLKIGFPPPIAATARALVRVNQHRIVLTELQAQSSTIAGLLSFTSGHKAADAAVETQVRIIRKQLGLPPPKNG